MSKQPDSTVRFIRLYADKPGSYTSHDIAVPSMITIGAMEQIIQAALELDANAGPFTENGDWVHEPEYHVFFNRFPDDSANIEYEDLYGDALVQVEFGQEFQFSRPVPCLVGGWERRGDGDRDGVSFSAEYRKATNKRIRDAFAAYQAENDSKVQITLDSDNPRLVQANARLAGLFADLLSLFAQPRTGGSIRSLSQFELTQLQLHNPQFDLRYSRKILEVASTIFLGAGFIMKSKDSSLRLTLKGREALKCPARTLEECMFAIMCGRNGEPPLLSRKALEDLFFDGAFDFRHLSKSPAPDQKFLAQTLKYLGMGPAKPSSPFPTLEGFALLVTLVRGYAALEKGMTYIVHDCASHAPMTAKRMHSEHRLAS